MDDLMIASIEPEKGKGHQENHSRCSFELTMGGGGGGGSPGRYAVEHGCINNVGRGGVSYRTWGRHLVSEPGHRRHGLGDTLGERGHLPL